MKEKLGDTQLYKQIAGNIEQKIVKQVLKPGNKLPSIRSICREQGVSMSTALEAYYYLEGKGLIASRPRSGYYVCSAPQKNIPRPGISSPGATADFRHTDNLVSKVFSNFHSDDEIMFSVGVPDSEFLPIARLNKEMAKAMRTLQGGGTYYESVQGNEKLRRQIAIQSLHWNGGLTPDDIIITSGCMEAICLSLIACTNPGDCIATESPVYFGLLQVALSLGLKVIELPTDAQTGIDVDTLRSLAETNKIKACCLISNFNNPLGSCMPDATKKEVTRILSAHNIALIEDDLYGDLYFGNHRPLTCKSFDTEGNVLWCGSISKTLAPGYRIGWVAPGKFKDKVLRQKLYNSISSPTITQEAVATFFETGRYENHLRKLRHTLYTNSLRLTDQIAQYFPEGTRISCPQGGFMLWIELDKRFDTALLFDAFKREHISIAPGRMFTLQNQYDNCMRMSFGLVWSKRIEQAIIAMGRILRDWE